MESHFPCAFIVLLIVAICQWMMAQPPRVSLRQMTCVIAVVLRSPTVLETQTLTCSILFPFIINALVGVRQKPFVPKIPRRLLAKRALLERRAPPPRDRRTSIISSFKPHSLGISAEITEGAGTHNTLLRGCALRERVVTLCVRCSERYTRKLA
jgi:hypothetical protein